jgi:hypothetical protein
VTAISYVPHAHQAKFHASAARFKLIRAGRQSGKSLGAIAELTSWVTETLGRGLYYWTTANYRVKDRAWRGLGEHLPKEIVKRKHESDLFIELTNGSRIYIRSADAPESLVSETLDGLVCDEAAQWKPEVWAQHLRPMLAVKKAPAVFVGSPRGRNWFYDLEMNARSAADPEWAAFAWRSIESPYFSKEEYDRAKLEMPERLFRQEIEAEYLADGGDVFRHIDAAIAAAVRPDEYSVMGVDLARVRDWTVMWTMNSLGEWVDVQRIRDLDWSLQKPRIVEAYRRNRCRRLLLDATGMHVGADAVVRDLQNEGVVVQPVTITGPIKRAMVEGLMLRFDSGSICIPSDPVVVEEFRGFTSEMLPSGHERFAAPSGRHDDCVMAAALAAWGIRQFSGRSLTTPGSRVSEENETQRALRLSVDREVREASGDWSQMRESDYDW